MTTTHAIAARIPGYNPLNLPVPAAQAFLSALAIPVAETETVGILDALGRVLAADVVSPVSVPPHDNSAMDGYAFDGAQLAGAQMLALQVVGQVLAGQTWTTLLAPGQCLKIMTGAPMPAGLDSVVPHERVQRQGTHIHFDARLWQPGANRRQAGEDVQQGQAALRQGERLSPAALGLLASLGLAEVRVFRRLRVAYFSTGDEILNLGEAPRPGAVFDSNRYTLFGLLTRLGVEVLDLGVVRDDPPLLHATFRQAASQADAILTSGGVSTGDADHTRSMMAALGDVVFWQLAMRPGRPMAVGLIPACAAQESQAKQPSSADKTCASSYEKDSKSAALLLGLPGNPVAVAVAFTVLVRPVLLQLMGCPPGPATLQPLLRARSAQALHKRPGRSEYPRGTLFHSADGECWVRLAGNQGSGVLSSVVQADVLLVLPEAQGDVAEGDAVDVMLLGD
jgi:molybdopterin molybdotransferase